MRNPKNHTLLASIAETLPAPGARLTSTALGNAVVAAPVVELNASLDTRRHLDPSATEVKYNPRYGNTLRGGGLGIIGSEEGQP